MFDVSETAKTKLLEVLADEGNQGSYVRIHISGVG